MLVYLTNLDIYQDWQLPPSFYPHRTWLSWCSYWHRSSHLKHKLVSICSRSSSKIFCSGKHKEDRFFCRRILRTNDMSWWHTFLWNRKANSWINFFWWSTRTLTSRFPRYFKYFLSDIFCFPPSDKCLNFVLFVYNTFFQFSLESWEAAVGETPVTLLKDCIGCWGTLWTDLVLL